MKKYFLAFLYSFAILLIGSFITSILYYFNITGDKFNNILLYFISISSIFIGSTYFSKNMKYKGIINGIIYFLIWFIIMLFLSLVIFKAHFGIKNIIYYIVLLMFSLIAGILGKNLDDKNDEVI
mgnify:FL=1